MSETVEKIPFGSLRTPCVEDLVALGNKSKFPKWGSYIKKVMAGSAHQITHQEKTAIDALLLKANTDYLAEKNSQRLFILGRNKLGYPALIQPVQSVANSARNFVPGRPRTQRNKVVKPLKKSNQSL